jgi:hypothetical protein
MRDSRVESIFSAALMRSSLVERAAYLDGACEGDADMRARVDTLLRSYRDADGFLEVTSAEEPPSEGPGTVIGRYKLLQQIGEGGFGIVYMAEQFEPVRRKVALKIIKLGMDTKQCSAVRVGAAGAGADGPSQYRASFGRRRDGIGSSLLCDGTG